MVSDKQTRKEQQREGCKGLRVLSEGMECRALQVSGIERSMGGVGAKRRVTARRSAGRWRGTGMGGGRKAGGDRNERCERL
jgi:hypothetical protein